MVRANVCDRGRGSGRVKGQEENSGAVVEEDTRCPGYNGEKECEEGKRSDI